MVKKKERVKRKVKTELKRVMNPQEDREILEELLAEELSEPEPMPAVAGDLEPGTIHHGLKVIWTYKKMCERFPIVSFVPEEHIPLTWNGVRVQAIANIEMHVPKPFYDMYIKHRRGVNLAKELPPGVKVEAGAGMLQ